jgi:hypothetical protein
MAGDTTRRGFARSTNSSATDRHAKCEPAVSSALSGEPIHPLAERDLDHAAIPGAHEHGGMSARVKRLAEGVASFDLPLTATGCWCNIMGPAGAEVRVDPLAEWKQRARPRRRRDGEKTSHTWKPRPRVTT